MNQKHNVTITLPMLDLRYGIWFDFFELLRRYNIPYNSRMIEKYKIQSAWTIMNLKRAPRLQVDFTLYICVCQVHRLFNE